jgi:lysophospholipase L1-like esterase
MAPLAGCGGNDAPADGDSSGVDGPVRIMAIGDSITAGPYYRPHLVRALSEAGCEVDFVGTFNGIGGEPPGDLDSLDLDHQAVGGATSGEIAEQMSGWLDELDPSSVPDVALVYLGINDFYRDISRSETIAEIESIIGDLREANQSIHVQVAQVMPAVAIEEGVAALNAELAALARGLDTARSPVEVVDLSTGFDVESDLLDGVHPNDDAARRLADLWVQALSPLLSDTCAP